MLSTIPNSEAKAVNQTDIVPILRALTLHGKKETVQRKQVSSENVNDIKEIV